MAELPKSVVARMKTQAAPQEHPDADLLAAFCEQALTGRERENVLAHLALCEACRETVALAAPQPAAEQPGGAFVPWYRRPQIFAWAGTLATLSLVAALVVNYSQSPRYTPASSDATAPKAAYGQRAENKPAAPREAQTADGTVAKLSRDQASVRAYPVMKPMPELKKKADEERSRNDLDARRAPAPTSAPLQDQAKDQKKLEGGPLPDQYSAMKQAAPAPAPPQPATVAGAANVATDEVRSTAAETVEVQSAAAPAKTAGEAGAVGGAAYAHKARMMAAAPVVRWSVSEKGKLQRSFDSGRTWQPVLANESTVFRSVAVVGNQVWAGGGAASLFHSADGGATWTKQALPGASADVVSLQFSDALHGSARTADEKAWSTNDGGQHWTKQ